MFNETGILIVQAILALTPSKNIRDALNFSMMEPNIPLNFQNETVKCYDIYGCFPIHWPWNDTIARPESHFPQPPEKIEPKFCLYTRLNDKCQILHHRNVSSILESYFTPSHPTYFITHGFLETGDRPWIKNITKALLKKGNGNVIVIDWGKGSLPPYAQATANIRLVGRVTAFLINLLRETTNLNAGNVHLIGHSLGAHLAGYVGNALKTYFHCTLGRITGMDPAEPHFSKMDPVVRLDETDASFVDIIHTNAQPFITGGLGIDETIGHLDFFPNGGSGQPGCNEGVVGFMRKSSNESALEGFKKYFSCDHIRSHELMLESMMGNECKMTSVACDTWENFTEGKCFPCEGKNSSGVLCSDLGFPSVENWKDLKPRLDGSHAKLFAITNDKYPFCAKHYRVTLKTSESAESVQHKGEIGQFYVSLRGSKGKTAMTKILKNKYFPPGAEEAQVVGLEDVGQVENASLAWIHSVEPFNPITYRIDAIIHVSWLLVETFDGKQRIKLCPTNADEILPSDTTIMLQPCSTIKMSSNSTGNS